MQFSHCLGICPHCLANEALRSGGRCCHFLLHVSYVNGIERFLWVYRKTPKCQFSFTAINPPYLTKINEYFCWSPTMFFHRLVCSSHHISEAQASWSGKRRTQALSLLVFNDDFGDKIGQSPIKNSSPPSVWDSSFLPYMAVQCCFASLNSLTPFHHTRGWMLLIVKCCLYVNFARCLGSFSKEGTTEM